jgi:atypical dual specificity phosphatase
MAGVDSIPGFGWLEPGRLAGMADPGSAREGVFKARLETLRQMGVGALVSLTERGLDGQALDAAGVEYLHLPMADMSAPSLEAMAVFVAFVEEAQVRGVGVAVHCGAGLGRTGTMLAAYLVSKRHMPDDAVRLVRELRPGAIETFDQERCVHLFAASLFS